MGLAHPCGRPHRPIHVPASPDSRARRNRSSESREARIGRRKSRAYNPLPSAQNPSKNRIHRSDPCPHSDDIRLARLLKVAGPIHDLYKAPAIYDIAFSWNPSTERTFYGRLLETHIQASSKPRLVVEFGCGTGRILRILARLGYPSVGLDLSPTMSHYAYRKGPSTILDIVTGDMKFLPFHTGAFTAALCTLSSINYLDSITALERHLKDASRVLSRRGVYVIDFLLGVPVRKNEEWRIRRNRRPYKVRWSIEPATGRPGKFLERVSVFSGPRPILRSRSFTSVIPRGRFTEAVQRAGFAVEAWFQPFLEDPLDEPPLRGRTIVVLRKGA